MADDTRKVRVEERLKVKIGEAKNLQGRSHCTNGSNAAFRDVYCTVALDQEEITRTPTIERTLSPFFGEEYQFEIPRKFRYLAVYIWDRDKHLKQDKAIGKIAIKREELHSYNHKDHWFALQSVDADSEVQGMAHIVLSIDDGIGNLKRRSDFDDSITLHTTKTTVNPTTNLNDLAGIGSTSSSSSSSVFKNDGNSEFKENKTSNDAQAANTHGGSIKTASCVSSSIPNNSSGNSGCSSTISKTRSIFGNTDLSLFSSQSKKTSSNTLDTLGSFRNGVKSRVAIRVLECVELAKKNGNCDPYIIVTAIYTNKKKIVKRTKSRKKTINPKFDETMNFDLSIDCDSKSIMGNNVYTVAPLDGADLFELSVTVWHDVGVGEDVFLGEIKIPLHGKQQQNAIKPDAWYYFQPRSTLARPTRSCATPPGTRLSSDNSLGSLRLKLVYTADHVFPLATYDNLLNLLIQSLQQPITLSPIYILGELVSNKTEIAQPLVRLFTHENIISPVIKALADYEISKLTDQTTIFRGNTLVSKMMDEVMRLSGLHYLHSTLRPIVDAILAEKKPCEIDPTRVKDKSMAENNLVNLQEYVERVFEAIINSAVRCPPILCQIFHDLRECAAKYFPHNKEVRYSVVSGFIFLRFFAPAILGPKLFDLTTEPLDIQTNRTLTLISKTINSLGNLVCSRSAQQPCKEEYTGQLYKKFCTEKHVEAVKHFLEVISTIGANPNENTLLEPVLLKEGVMTKRSQGRRRFGRHNFRQRYFRLTTQSLSYAKSKGKNPICDIPLSEILAVERLNERSFKLQNIFQIIRKDRTLYVKTSNCVEEKDWVDLLSKICQSNAARLESFHPSAYISGAWTCCKERDQYVKGCQTVSPSPFQMGLATTLDPARDLQRLNTLIINNLDDLKLFTEPNSVYSKEIVSPEDLHQFHKNVKAMIDTAVKLQQIHLTYRALIDREMKYGSRQAPIGDDNYLHLIRSGMCTGSNQNSTATLPTLNHHRHHNLGLDKSPNLFIRNEMTRNSLTNEKFSHY
ncbi:GTPase-activating protein [Contarinia nasturtii]|uniref:GTPase-activating protein n=1 Tax=Contarinia nasturtii TaxID=265458 RepID=UPI0012D46C2A|nr:GTPase-activating protein [Contarinia nasturtii]